MSCFLSINTKVEVDDNSITTKNNDILRDYPTLPIDGWIKPCCICEIQTSRFVVINNDKYYICFPCIKKKKYIQLFRKYECVRKFLIDK